MNFEMADANVQQHMNEVSDQVTRSRRRPSAPRNRGALRNRLGITLVEAGLHLMAADGPQGAA
jgi:hypothetical protein